MTYNDLNNDSPDKLAVQFDTLRQDIDHELRQMVRDGADVNGFPPELVKLGALMGLALVGPVETMGGMMCLLRQLAEQFPDEYKMLTLQQSDVAGHA